jgi:hypothetical protein
VARIGPDGARGKFAQPAPDEPDMGLRALAPRFNGAMSKSFFFRASSSPTDDSSRP